MAVLPIIQLQQPNIFCPDSCLRLRCSEINEDEFFEEWFRQLVKDMLETLYACSSGVGLSANQIGILKKISIIDLNRDAKKPMVLVNPMIVPLSDEKIKSTEVCLSFPDISVSVQRYKKIKVIYQDINGNKQEFVAEGYKSNVFQHEISHLYGKAHVDMVDSKDDIVNFYGTAVSKMNMAYKKVLEG